MMLEPGDRLNVIAGDNGLGKSFLLDLAWWAVTRTWAGRPITPRPGLKDSASVAVAFEAISRDAVLTVQYDVNAQDWRFPKGKPGEPGLVVYARVDGDFAVWDSSRRFGDPQEADGAAPKGLIFDRKAVWDGLRLDDKPICNGLLADWVSWQQTASFEFRLLQQALVTMSPSKEEPILPGRPARIDANDARLIPTIQTRYGEDIPVTLASAGMRRILAIAYMLVWAWGEHIELARLFDRRPAPRMLVLIDEVELHLHPKWQRVILPSILEAVERITQVGFNASDHHAIQMIVSTHSPLVMASLEPLFDSDLDCLFELELRQGSTSGGPPVVTLSEEPFVRQGDAEDWLVSDLFGLSSSRSVQAESAMARASALSQDGTATPADVAEIEAELQAVLTDVDPFWSRWRAVRKAVDSRDQNFVELQPRTPEPS